MRAVSRNGSISVQKVGMIMLILLALAVYLAFFLEELPNLVDKFNKAVEQLSP